MVPDSELLAIGKAIHGAAENLPEGWSIAIEVERGAGTVRVSGPGFDDIIDSSDPLSDQIAAAMDVARGRATKVEPLPFMAIGGDDLGDEFGDAVRCDKCGGTHPLAFPQSRRLLPDGGWSEPVTDKTMAFYSCGDQTYLAGVGGRYMAGLQGASTEGNKS